MAEQQTQSPYGYSSDEVKISPFRFGLNTDCKMVKCEYITNAGKEGAEGEALDIIFMINEVEKSYRMFPMTKAFGKNNEEITDPSRQEFQDAAKDYRARIVHILHCFADDDVVKAALSKPVRSFKEYCQMIVSVLPKDFTTKPLHVFLQYQWQISPNQKRTYLELPKKMSYGRWICAAIEGDWKEVRVPNPTDDVTKALYYQKVSADGLPISKDGKPVEHPFVKNGWFMNSNFANQQKIAGDDEQSTTEAADNMNAGTSVGETSQASSEVNTAANVDNW